MKTNFYHKELEKLGEEVVRDEVIGNSHAYYFSCGCVRAYLVNPITLTDEEKLYPCDKHKDLVK